MNFIVYVPIFRIRVCTSKVKHNMVVLFIQSAEAAMQKYYFYYAIAILVINDNVYKSTNIIALMY